jgi:hypothetical protein
MKTANEIRSNLENIKMYVAETKKLVKQQLDIDLKDANDIVNVQPASIRYDALGCIYMVCGLFETYLDNIEANLVNAESRDKVIKADIDNIPLKDQPEILF